MNLKEIIKPEYCKLLTSRTKTEALLELVDLVKTGEEISDIEDLKKEIFFREQLMSTGIGQGIGIPHVRFAGVKHPVILVGVSAEGIDDYGSMDGNPVNFVFLFIVGKEQHKEYLRLLSLVSSKVKDENFRNILIKTRVPGEIARFLAEGDTQ